MKGWNNGSKPAVDVNRGIEKSETSSSGGSSDGLIKDGMTFRQKLAHHLHSKRVQIIIIVLVIVDCLLVLGELFIDLDAFSAQTSNSESTACIPEQNKSEHLESNEREEHHDAELIVAEVLHICSIVILSVFLIELVLKVFAMGKEFFKHAMEVIDGVVIIVSFALDVAFLGKEGLTSFFGLLVLVRLWRVARIVNGVILSVKSQLEKKLAREKSVREAAEDELTKFKEYCTAQEQQIEALQLLLTSHDIAFQKMKRVPRPVPTMDVVAEVNQYITATQSIEEDEKPPVELSRSQLSIQVNLEKPPIEPAPESPPV